MTTNEFSSIITGPIKSAPGTVEAATGVTLEFAAKAAPTVWAAGASADIWIHIACADAVLDVPPNPFPTVL